MRVGLTGGVASGKSTVSAMLAELGAVVIDADALAREVVEPGTPGWPRSSLRSATTCSAPTGGLDRPALGALVFADEQKRARARGDPASARASPQRRARGGGRPGRRLVVHDIPLLAEAGQGAAPSTR